MPQCHNTSNHRRDVTFRLTASGIPIVKLKHNSCYHLRLLISYCATSVHLERQETKDVSGRIWYSWSRVPVVVSFKLSSWWHNSCYHFRLLPRLWRNMKLSHLERQETEDKALEFWENDCFILLQVILESLGYFQALNVEYWRLRPRPSHWHQAVALYFSFADDAVSYSTRTRCVDIVAPMITSDRLFTRYITCSFVQLFTAP